MRHLAKLLDKTEAEVAQLVNRLEETSGFPAEDARLLAQMSQQTRAKIASLGLDPDDTTAEELHHALLVKYQQDSAQLERALGLNQTSSAQERSQKAIGLLKHLVQPADGWFIKTAIIKKYIQSHPPKKLMKSLAYRSVVSMLKRQNLAEIVLGAQQLEAATWCQNYRRMVKRLPSSSYELRQGQLITFGGKWPAIGMPAVTADKLFGAVGIYPQDNPNVLSAVILAASQLKKVNPRQQITFDNIHPALTWWLGAQHLVSLHQDGRTVSLHIADVAHNNHHQLAFKDRQKLSAQTALMDKLKSSYHKYLQDLPEAVELEAEKLANAEKVMSQPVLEEIEI